MHRFSHICLRALLLFAVAGVTGQLKAFTSCPPFATTITGFTIYAANCTTGHYFITTIGLAQLNLSIDAVTALANADIDVDSYEAGWHATTFGHSCSGTSQFFQLYDKAQNYNAAHHFDRKGSFETTPFAFIRGANYVQNKRAAFISAIHAAQTCQDVANALVILGQALHALQDVYSHSNYVDLDAVTQIDIEVAITTATAPPDSFILTGFDPDEADDEIPLADPYPHCLKAKDYPHKNPESDLPDPFDPSPNPRTKYDAAKAYAIIATGKFVQGIATEIGNDWSKALNFGTPGWKCSPTVQHPIEIITSFDPNDKSGPTGFGVQRFVTSSAPLTYSVFFENDPAATAPAQTVTLIDVLPAQTDELSTFSLGPISVGNQVVLPGPGSTFSGTMDLRPQTNLLLGINVGLSLASGQVQWKFTSLDPATGQPTTDPTAGFLAPGASANVSFTVLPKQGVSTGSEVQNHATVVFDKNAPIDTPTWTNTFDVTPPTSAITPLETAASTSCLLLHWTGSDVGAGVKNFNIYVSEDGGQYTPWLTNSLATSAVFRGQPGHSYAFFSQAQDFVGNLEPAKTGADASTAIMNDTSCNGRPVLVGSIVSNSLSGTTETVVIQFTNGGVGDSAAVTVSQIKLRTLIGQGVVTLSSPVPISLGPLEAGASTTVTLTFNMPATVQEFALTETGTIQDVSGAAYTFAIGQTILQTSGS